MRKGTKDMSKAATETAEKTPIEIPEKTVEERQAEINARAEEYVEYTAPLMGGTEQPPIYVACNGESIAIRRGEPVKIKRKFVEILESANRQELAALRARQKAIEQSRKPLAEL